jgi:ribonuclease D
MLPPAQYIDHDQPFRKLIHTLAQEPLLAIDTESNSLYAYRERVCLIQISTRTTDYIVDPLRIADLSAFGPLLADRTIKKVFHAAEYDLICLKRDYGFEVHNLFDTMIAARICGRKTAGLDKLLLEFCGVQADKSHQRDDWGQRPLSKDSLRYAQMDTHYLPALYDLLQAELEAKGLVIEAEETFAEYSQVPVTNNHFDPEGFWRIGIPADLNRRQMALLKELYLLRESLAEERDVPPFKVFNDKVLVGLAEAAPGHIDELSSVPGMTPGQIRRYGRQILHALERGKHAPNPKMPPRPPDIAPVVVEMFTALREWRRDRAEERGVESDVVISKDALWALAYKMPTSLDDMRDIHGLGPWRLATYGQELLDVIREFRSKNGMI